MCAFVLISLKLLFSLSAFATTEQVDYAQITVNPHSIFAVHVTKLTVFQNKSHMSFFKTSLILNCCITSLLTMYLFH